VLRSEPVLDATVEILLSERRTCHQEEENRRGRLLELLILSRADERVEDAAVVGDIAEMEVLRDPSSGTPVSASGTSCAG
jgi:hypothetical protein